MYKPLARHQDLRKGRQSIPNTAYLITTATFNRHDFFKAFPVARAACLCFENADILGDAQMLAWVLMPDHVHWLLQLNEKQTLGSVVNRLKSASARQSNLALRRQGSIWAKAYHDHALRSEESLIDVARYIIANPLRAGLVNNIGDYPFWNAVWL